MITAPGCIVSLDLKSLYTNVPVNEAVGIALSLYSIDHAPEISRSTLKKVDSLFQKIAISRLIIHNTDLKRQALHRSLITAAGCIASLDVKSLYTNVPVIEAIEIALSLYSSDHAPETSRSALKTLLNLAVTNVCFKCNDRWFCQVDGSPMGASLAVTLANIWRKSFEHPIKSTKEIINKIPKNDLEACPEGNRRVTYRGNGVECEKSENWLHAK